MTTYTCINDRYDPDGSEGYETIAEFRAMCIECFGESPDLMDQGDVVVDRATGENVLVRDQ